MFYKDLWEDKSVILNVYVDDIILIGDACDEMID